MVLSGQPLYAMATLTPGKELPLPIEQGVSWVPGQALRLRKREKSLTHSDDRATIYCYSASCGRHTYMLIRLLHSSRIVLGCKFSE